MSADDRARELARLAIAAGASDGPQFRFGTVTTASPLGVTFDGSDQEMPMGFAGSAPAASDRVLALWIPEAREWVVLGVVTPP